MALNPCLINRNSDSGEFLKKMGGKKTKGKGLIWTSNSRFYFFFAAFPTLAAFPYPRIRKNKLTLGCI
jgi:hypothetical protein